MSHESPVVFWSLFLGGIGPVMVLTVPPIRKSLGYVPPEHFPTSYPLPKRPRQAVSGYED
ncbi:NADH-ubiquinone oxidoreductase 9.5 kDa subunit [Clavulina sp. PMI_390]|nr:NADH-ubiquinone oxidoreductase 9.5 kDa subunit [Clavulina sp. PMI_390]